MFHGLLCGNAEMQSTHSHFNRILHKTCAKLQYRKFPREGVKVAVGWGETRLFIMLGFGPFCRKGVMVFALPMSNNGAVIWLEAPTALHECLRG